MPHFRYRAITRSGEVVLGEVEAPSREEVIRRIEYLGYLPVEAEVESKGLLARTGLLDPKIPRPREVTIFLRQLALLVGAGLTLEAALQTLADDASKPLARFVTTLRSGISAGQSFTEVLEGHAAVIEPAYVAMIRAGEAAGTLERVLSAIVADRVRREALAERFNSAIRYPIFLVAAAILILMFFLVFVVPQFEPVFKDLGGRLNAGATLVLAASSWLRANLNVFLSLTLALALAAWLILRQRKWRGRLVPPLSPPPRHSRPLPGPRTGPNGRGLRVPVEKRVRPSPALWVPPGVLSE